MARTRMMATPVQTAAVVVSVVFLLVGVLGFIPGITTDFDTMEFSGPESEAMLPGIFQVSVFHNISHLLFGIAGLMWRLLQWVTRTALAFDLFTSVEDGRSTPVALQPVNDGFSAISRVVTAAPRSTNRGITASTMARRRSSGERGSARRCLAHIGGTIQ